MFLIPVVIPVAIGLGVVFLPIWHWTTKDEAYFERIGVAHSTWKALFVIGLFGPMPLVALAWWWSAIGNALRGKSRGVSPT